MIRLDTTTRTLKAVLAGAITTNQLACTVGYSDAKPSAYVGAAQLTATNSTTPVTICAAPTVATQPRDIDYIAIHNTDTVASTVTVSIDDNGTLFPQVKATLQPGRQLFYTHASGWCIGPIDATPLPGSRTALAGMSAINGTAATYARSDSAPAIDAAITPIWTGSHRWNFNGVAPLATISTTAIQLSGADGGTPAFESNSFAGENAILVRRANNTAAAPSALALNNTILALRAFGYGTTTYSASTRAGLLFRANEAWTDTAQGTYVSIFATLNGSTTLNEITRFNGDKSMQQMGKIFPGTDAAAFQTVCGLYANTGAPNNANGNNGDFYFNAAGGALTSIYQRRAGVWVGIV